MTPADALTILNFLEQAPTHTPATLRQGEILIRYAQPDTPAADLIRRDAEMLLALSPHALPGPQLVELDLGGRRVRHAFSLQSLPGSDVVHGQVSESDAVWRQVGEYMGQLHSLPILATGVVVPSPDPLRLLDQLNEEQIITDHDLSWLEIWIKSLQKQAAEPRFATLHGSLRPSNLLLSRDRKTFLGLVDWSRAQAGEAARDFVYLPLEACSVIGGEDAQRTASLLLAFVTRLMLDLREASQGRLALAAATSRLFALFQFNLRRRA